MTPRILRRIDLRTGFGPRHSGGRIKLILSSPLRFADLLYLVVPGLAVINLPLNCTVRYHLQQERGPANATVVERRRQHNLLRRFCSGGQVRVVCYRYPHSIKAEDAGHPEVFTFPPCYCTSRLGKNRGCRRYSRDDMLRPQTPGYRYD